MRRIISILIVISILITWIPAYALPLHTPTDNIRVGLYFGEQAPNQHIVGSEGVFSVGILRDGQRASALMLEGQEVMISQIRYDMHPSLDRRYDNISDAFDGANGSAASSGHIFFDGQWSSCVESEGRDASMGLLIRGINDRVGVVFPLEGKISISFETGDSDMAGTLRINGNSYRGVLEFLYTDMGGFTVVNQLDLEDYLYGVLPKEMPTTWAHEALKAQAVASRTYAIKNLGKWASYGFDVKSDTSDQHYEGLDVEHVATNLAVDETAGQVLLYDDEPITAFYHSDSGGVTEECGEAFGSNLPYLVSVRENFITQSPNSVWEVPIQLSSIDKKPEVTPQDIGSVKKIEITKRSPSGRVTEVRLIGNRGDTYLKYSQIRSVFAVKSNLFELIPSNQGDADYIAKGSGFGHGVGMSQWGAKAMADEGYNYMAILQHYYKNTQIQNPLIPGYDSTFSLSKE